MQKKIREILTRAILEGKTSGSLSGAQIPPVPVEIPRDHSMGDFASPIAFILAPSEKKPPIKIAEIIATHLQHMGEGIIERVDVAGKGYINIFLKREAWLNGLKEAVMKGDKYGQVNVGNGEPVQIEFVSANPTGPLHIGHGRGAAFGDSLANLLQHGGYKVEREYYINDVGTQMEMLGRSTFIRYKQIFDPSIPFPENGYKGSYIQDIAREILATEGKKYLHMGDEEAIPIFTEISKEWILRGIRKDLEDFNVSFDKWFSEKSLFEKGEVEKVLKELQEKGYIYEREGALWLKTSLFGDDKDRVVVRSNGQTTYFASDIAYHKNKLSRGFKLLIDIWGADHHGYEPRLRAGIKALGYPEDRLKIILVQFVTLLRGGKPVSMSTRAGEFITLREVLDEIGSDAARFMFLTRRPDSHLEFDLDIVKKESSENPVYYVEYAHARIASIFRQAESRGIPVPDINHVDLSLLSLPEEIKIIKTLVSYPDLIEGCTRTFEPHRITFYLQDLASLFHNYYFHHRILTDNKGLTEARLMLVTGVKNVLKNALAIIGIKAPERM